MLLLLPLSLSPLPCFFFFLSLSLSSSISLSRALSSKAKRRRSWWCVRRPFVRLFAVASLSLSLLVLLYLFSLSFARLGVLFFSFSLDRSIDRSTGKSRNSELMDRPLVSPVAIIITRTLKREEDENEKPKKKFDQCSKHCLLTIPRQKKIEKREERKIPLKKKMIANVFISAVKRDFYADQGFHMSR